MGIIARIQRGAALCELVERGNRQIQMPLKDHLRHLLIEESDEQGGDVGSVDISISHDDDLLVPQIRI